jgi:hypothetical protein
MFPRISNLTQLTQEGYQTMKKLLSYAVVLGLVMTGVALTSETQATCPLARLFNSSTPGAGYSYIYTPGVLPGALSTSVTENMVGSFWAMGAGIPGTVPQQGIDNGIFPAIVVSGPGYFYYGWVRGFPLYAAYIQGPAWSSSPDIDGCPDAVIGQRCMAILLTDQVDGVGYFAFLTDEADGSQNYDFIQAGNLPINLVQIPKPAISGSTTIDIANVDVIIQGPTAVDIAGGLYLDPACAFGDVVGYKIRSQTFGFGGVPPTDRSVASWTDITPGGGTVPLGTPTTVRITCGANSDVYLATTLEFDSGFEFGLTGENSTRVACGPTIAEPGPIDRKPSRRPARKTKR